MCGEESAFRLGIEREDDQKRKTSLFEKLTEVQETPASNNIQAEQPEIINEETIMMVDPMIGMENVSPYDFVN